MDGAGAHEQPARRRKHRDDLQGADYRPTRLPFDTALRAREVATPSQSDLADAAAQLTLVRRKDMARGERA